MKKFIFFLALIVPVFAFADDDFNRMADQIAQWERESINRDLKDAIDNRDMEEIEYQQERMDRRINNDQYRRLMND